MNPWTTSASTGKAWPLPELMAVGIPEGLAGLIATLGLLAALALVAFLVYCVWAGTVYKPRTEKALDVLMRLDPPVYQAFPERNSWGDKTGNLDVAYLASLHPLLEAEDEVRTLDRTLEDARDRVAFARKTDPDEERVWVCGTCGHSPEAHGMSSHPAFNCVYRPVLRKALA